MVMALSAAVSSEYDSWEDRPTHPVTGVPADYFWEVQEPQPDGTYQTVRYPRWRDPFTKDADPARCWYSVKEVAKLTGRDVQWVRKVCRQGRLRAHKPKGTNDWFIRGSDLIGFIENRGDVAPLPEPVTVGGRP